MKRSSVPVFAACLMIAALTATVLSQDGPGASPPDDPMIAIDGAKDPEKVPEWFVWREAFRIMAAPPEPEIPMPIPTPIWHVTSPGQRMVIRRTALRLSARDDALMDVAVKLLDGANAENMPARAERMDSLEMERRRETLAGRDQLLAALPVEAQVALRSFVDEIRKGTKFLVRKSQMTQYMLPE